MVVEEDPLNLGLANGVMGELQATLDVQVELGKFYNVDLFQRGYYQIRTALKTAPKVPVKTEVSLPHNSECDLVFPASIINGVAVSKTFQILYRNEDVIINDIIQFKIHLLTDAIKVDEGIEAADLQLVVELWFSDDEFGPDQQEKLNCISSRTLKLNLAASKGIHHHVPILFDYFHLSAVTVTIHSTLLSLSQPYLNLRQPPIPGQQPPKQAWSVTKDSPTLETILFGTNISPATSNHKYALNPKLEHAYKMHKTVCNTLLSVYESLQASFESLTRKLPSHIQMKIEHVDCHQKLEKITNVLKKVTDEETLLEMATSDIAQLCAENVILWAQYLELVTSNDTINHILAKEHHTQRIKRFSEAFFTNEFSKQAIVACYEPSVNGHSDLAALVKASPYFQGLLQLSVECWDMDGDHTTLPVVFEDIYCEASIAKHLHTSEEMDEMEDKTAGELSSSGGASSLTRKGSRHSDTSSQYSSDSSSPRLKKNKLKFIKNIKPEAFKRPSAFMTADGSEPRNAGGSVAVDPLDCSLVGYRKLDNTPSIPVVELGTLSPGGTHNILLQDAATKNALYNAVSMPTLLAKGHFNMTGSGSMPDLSTESLLDKSSIDLSHMIQAGLTGGGSDSALTKEKEVPGTTTQLERTNINDNLVTDDKDSGSSSISPSDSSSNLQNVQNGYITSESDKNSPTEPTADSTHVDYNLIADSLSKALGESEDKNSSKSEETSQQENETSLHQKETEISSTKPVVNTQTNGDNSKVAGATGGLAKMDSQGSGSSKGGDTSVSEGSKGGDTSGLGESVSTLHTEPSQDDPDADTMSIDSKPKSEESDEYSLSGTCTLMELLKEEYERSERAKARKQARERAHPVVSSTHSLSSIQINEKGSRSSRAVNRQTHGERIMSLMVSSSTPDLSQYRKEQCLVSPVGDSTINFITAKENLRRQMKYNGHIYSDFPSQVSTLPYFWTPEINRSDDDGIHLIVCAHGLDGNSADLRLIRTYLEMALPNARLDFLMSERNQPDTFADFEVMTDRLVDEILYHIELYGISPSKISFVGHSLGNIIIRSALSRPKMATLLPKLHTFLSLSGPHLGTLYNTSGLVNMGMWFMQKWKKSGSLLQLALKDHPDPRQTFLYQLSTRPGLEFFKNILLVGSSQDRYVPFHSSRIELCKAAAKDSSTLGAAYCEMANNILQPIVYNSSITFIRYDVFHALPNTANSLIGRAAHIAVLDSELFIEKFITVSALKYFK